MELKESFKTCLLHGKQLSDNKISAPKDSLHNKTLQELHILAKDVNVRLTGLSHKTDTVNRLIGMARIWATLEDLDEETDFSKICYITHEVKSILHSLPAF